MVSEEKEQGLPCTLCRDPGPPMARVFDSEPDLLRCSSCGVARLEHVLSESERSALYQEDYYDGDRGERFSFPLEHFVIFFRWIRARDIERRLDGPGRILDIGCGRGRFLDFLSRRGFETFGTQLSLTAARASRERGGTEILIGELPDLDLQEASFDVVTFYHVLEHLAEPDEYLRQAWSLLREDGLLLIEVPDFGSPGFRFLGRRNLCFDYPHHIFFFSRESLEKLVSRCGFRSVSSSYFSLEYSPITTLQNLLNFLPGSSNRFLESAKNSSAARSLRRQPLTWLHMVLAVFLAPVALAISLLGMILPVGNTYRLYCRKQDLDGDLE